VAIKPFSAACLAAEVTIQACTHELRISFQEIYSTVRPERFKLPTLWFIANDIDTAPLILNG
jgi:hypothetical protein